MSDDFSGIMDYHRTAPRVKLEEDAAGVSLNVVGSAKAELLRRDRQHSEAVERQRQEFENTVADKHLAAADKQLDAAVDVATATKWAAIAAVAAAVGALVQGGAAVLVLLR